jgi:arabinofuranan 3-O-arabinosyltransferase
VAIAYLPPLLSSPGRVSADSKQALLVDPARFLAGAASMWDAGTGGGTVPHQHLGFLWPMGPWFWVFERLGAPVWVAQRLWLGTLVLLAALGARWLVRSLGTGPGPALVAGLVYALTPYQLAYTARMSVILLPWVGLPWMVELTRRSVRHGGWRHPALFGLVLVSASGVNATALVLVGLGPLVLLTWLALTGPVRPVLAATLRIAAVSLGVSAWWLAGLVVQGRHGMPVLQLTESLHEIARWSRPAEVLRGLGSWFFAGRDRLGYSIDQAETYLESQPAIALTALAPATALAALVLLRGRVRALAVGLLLVGTVVAVGAWPLDRPSPYGRAFRWFAEETSAGLALRNSQRVVPLVVLGAALATAVVLDRLPRGRVQQVASVFVGLAACAALAPALPTGLLARHIDRPEALPDHWLEASALVESRGADAEGNPWRVLELPGSPFAAYRWGNTVEPVLPALVDRPQLAREVLPYGSPATANLLDALDRRLQEGVFEREALAPIARLLGTSDVVVRNDLQWERFGVPSPAAVWQQLVAPSAPGVSETMGLGEGPPGDPDRALAPIGERELAADGGSDAELPQVAILAVDGVEGLLRAIPAARTLVVAGDGEGLVDLAAAGLLSGEGVVHYADALDDAALDRALDDGAWLAVTDSNRRRIETWFYAVRDVRGPTERAGETLAEPSGYDRRLEVFPGATDDSRTTVEHVGATLTASLTGGAARPEDRAAAAVDGDLGTAWRVGGADPAGHRISMRFDQPVTLDELVIVQPQDGPRDRWVEEVRLYLDGGEPITVALDEWSRTPDGQRIAIEPREVGTLEIELARISVPPFDPALANAVGFAEVVVPGLEIAETVVVPRSLLDRVGERSLDHGLDVVLTRWRYDPYARGRTDIERHLDRTVELPTPRTFALAGRARVSAATPDPVLDALLGTTLEVPGGPAVSVTASSRLLGDLEARASSALDGDPTTAWTAAFGPQEGQWVELTFDEPTGTAAVRLRWRDDERHSVPTVVAVSLDGVDVAVVDTVADGVGSRVAEVALDRPASRLRITVVDIERRSAPTGDPAPFATLPVSLVELDAGVVRHPALAVIDTGCRADLLSVDGSPVEVRVLGSADHVREGLDVVPCADLDLDAGRHRLVAEPGWRVGIDLDRLVLSSAPGGDAAPVAPRDAAEAVDRPVVQAVDASATRWTARVTTDGEPFWLVLAQSHEPGWTASVGGDTLGAPTLVGGFANGWLVEPAGPGTLEVELRWTPQRGVWIALALSTFVVGLCIGLAVGTRPVEVTGELGPEDALWRPAPGPLVVRAPVRASVLPGVATALLMGLVSRPWVALASGFVAVALVFVPRLTPAVAVAAPAALALALLGERHVVGWLAVGLVVGAAATQLSARITRRPGGPPR